MYICAWQGCLTALYQSKTSNLGKFWRVVKMLESGLKGLCSLKNNSTANILGIHMPTYMPEKSFSFSERLARHFISEANPTIVSYNACAVKIYNATSSQVGFENNFFYFEKTL
jgi:hypothetical protein